MTEPRTELHALLERVKDRDPDDTGLAQDCLRMFAQVGEALLEERRANFEMSATLERERAEASRYRNLHYKTQRELEAIRSSLQTELDSKSNENALIARFIREQMWQFISLEEFLAAETARQTQGT